MGGIYLIDIAGRLSSYLAWSRSITSIISRRVGCLLHHPLESWYSDQWSRMTERVLCICTSLGKEEEAKIAQHRGTVTCKHVSSGVVPQSRYFEINISVPSFLFFQATSDISKATKSDQKWRKVTKSDMKWHEVTWSAKTPSQNSWFG